MEESTNSVQCQIDSSEEIKEIAPALLKAQKAMGSAKKGADNPFFKSKYADYNSVLSACKDQLNDSGIIILQPTSVRGDMTLVSTLLLHESGQWIRATMIALETKDMQKAGSSVSYAARYTLQRLVALPSSEDDDGNIATGKGKSKPAASKPKEEPKSRQSAISNSAKPKGFGAK